MIVIYGASGHTGSLIAKALREQNLAFAMAGRSLERLQKAALATKTRDLRVASVDQPDTLCEIFKDADVVVNCAGPFLDIGETIIAAALRADSHYVDTSGEQHFVRTCYERFESAARKARRVVANACAFEIALGDWAAHLAADALRVESVDSISVSYAIDNLSPTRGTQLTILDSLGKDGVLWEDGRWIRVAPGGDRLKVEYPQPFGPRLALSFPSSEVITIPRHIEVRRVQTYISIGQDTPLLRAASTVAPLLSPLLGPLLRSTIGSSLNAIAESTIRASAPSPEIHSGRFAITAQAHSGQRTARCSLSGEDIYGVTAGIATLAANQLRNRNKDELSGVLSPTGILPPREALEKIAEKHKLYLELP